MAQSIKVLWLAPNMNHYKSRFLNHLAVDASIDLHVFSGSGRSQMGDKALEGDWSFQQVNVDVPKKDFGNSKLVKERLNAVFGDFDWIMIPAEKKNILLFLYALKLKKRYNKVKLFSYNHPILKSGNGKVLFLDKLLTKFYFRKLDRVIFYTEHSCAWAVKHNLVKKKKAFWANNTIDDSEIKKHYSYTLPPENLKTILFIGRLISSKRIPDLLLYYKEVKKVIPELILEIIGDGPESHHIKSILDNEVDIKWHGTLVDEKDIAPIMSRASLIFIPGHSGLSVNHAFAYGRPYITLQGPSHAPELDYLNHGENGYILDNNLQANVEIIYNLLTDRSTLKRFSENAKQKGEYLSVKKWVKQIVNNLLHD